MSTTQTQSKAPPRPQTQSKTLGGGQGRAFKKGAAKDLTFADLLAAAPVATGNVRDEIHWVSAYVGCPLSQIPLESIPSRSAVNLLREYQELGPALFKDFYAKLIPSKGELDRMAERSAGSGNVDRVLADLEKPVEAPKETDQ